MSTAPIDPNDDPDAYLEWIESDDVPLPDQRPEWARERQTRYIRTKTGIVVSIEEIENNERFIESDLYDLVENWE